MNRIVCALALAAGLFAASPARASDPVGGYLIVDRVVLTPSVDPNTIQIWGNAVLAKGLRTRSYGAPQRGYLYYKVAPGKEAVCRKEWSDLKKVAGTGQVIGFGSTYEPEALGKVRAGGKKPDAPDVYPLGNGLVKFPADTEYAPIRNLLALPSPRAPADGDLVPPGKVTLVTRNILDKKHHDAQYVFELIGDSGAKEEGTVEAGAKETSWTPKLKMKPGEKWTWRVGAKGNKWSGPVATTHFTVKGEK